VSWKNIKLIFMREVRDQLRDRRTLFMITILPLFLYPMLGLGVVQMMLTFSEQQRVVVILNADELPDSPAFLNNDGIHSDWYENGKKDTSRLRILAERTSSTLSEAAPDALTSTGDETPEAPEEGPGRRGEKSDAELLAAAHSLYDQIETLES
jgi:sodium transport system permease protein